MRKDEEDVLRRAAERRMGHESALVEVKIPLSGLHVDHLREAYPDEALPEIVRRVVVAHILGLRYSGPKTPPAPRKPFTILGTLARLLRLTTAWRETLVCPKCRYSEKSIRMISVCPACGFSGSMDSGARRYVRGRLEVR